MGQPWRFIIVNNKEWIKKLSDESKKNVLSYIELNPDAPLKKYESVLRDKDFNVFYNAPCLVYIGGSEDIRSLQVDCALAACYFMFSAAARGLGTCWVGLAQVSKTLRFGDRLGCPVITASLLQSLWGIQEIFRGGPMLGRPRFLRWFLENLSCFFCSYLSWEDSVLSTKDYLVLRNCFGKMFGRRYRRNYEDPG